MFEWRELMQARRQDFTTSIGLLVLRLVAGAYLICHGWGKLHSLLDGKMGAIGDPIGLGKGVSLVLVVFAEVVCAGLVILGLATRLAAIPVVIAMSVAAFVVHAQHPWVMGGGPSKEPALLYLAVYAALFFTGAGKFSLDAVFWRRSRGKAEK
jgi:putative oxidoreductase